MTLWVRSIKKNCIALNYIEHLLILTSTVPGFVSISTFASLVNIPVGITSSAVGLNLCVITTEIRKCKLSKRKRSMINSIASEI